MRYSRTFILLGLVTAVSALPLGMGGGIPVGASVVWGAKKVDNPHGKYRGDCSMCHSPDAWKPARISKRFDHEKFLPLSGAHASVNCMQCHKSLDFTETSAACIDCHSDVHNGELGTDCSRCHGTTSFNDRGDQIQLHRLTRFPLGGAHATLDCEMCHQHEAAGKLSYVNTPTDCESCHMKDFNATTDPDHVKGGFSRDCTQCHDDRSWHDAHFDHASSGFPLSGAHKALSCDACHKGGVFTGLTSACVSCHQSDYNGTTDPAHAAAGFSTDCLQCHNTIRWQDAHFDHSQTNFPLTGAHKVATCDACHVGGKYSGLSTACISCHQTDYNGTTDPAHAAAGFSTDCTQCHTTTSWQGANFDHSATNFPLTGAHKAVACDQCHVGGTFSGLSTACISCHQNDYNGTTDPNHVSAGFPTDCTQCHSTTSWQGASFDHSQTNFPLTGAHVTVACATCHAGGVYTGLATACVSCHQNDYNSVTDPNHAAAGFPTDCTQCHNTTQWAGAQFDHTQWFPIYSGTHKGRWQSCSDCHTSTSSFAQFDCLQCHPHDDKAQTDSHHQGRSGYSYDSNACYRCHPSGRSG